MTRKSLDVDITVEKVPHSGALKLSTFVPSPNGDHLLTETYYGYEEIEAVQDFAAYVQGLVRGGRIVKPTHYEVDYPGGARIVLAFSQCHAQDIAAERWGVPPEAVRPID